MSSTSSHILHHIYLHIVSLHSNLCVCVCVCMHLDSASPSKRTSVSSSHSVVDSDSAASINLNMEQNNVNFHVKKQSKYPHVPPAAEQKGKYSLLRYVLYVRMLGHSDIVCHTSHFPRVQHWLTVMYLFIT